MASIVAYAYGGSGALFVLAVTAASYAASQSVVMRRLYRQRPLQLSLQEGEDRRFLLDLSGGVRAAANVVQLYEQVAGKIAREFRVDCVSLFIRDDATGDFVCRVTHGLHGRTHDSSAHLPRLAGNDFVVRRLRHLASPLAVDPRSFDLWVRAATPEARAARAREAAVLRRLDARGEEFGGPRLRDCVVSFADLTVEEICARVVRRVDEWCAGTPQHDDLTLVVLKVK